MSSYVLEMILFDPSYVNLCDETFTLCTENRAGDPRSIGLVVKDWHRYHFPVSNRVSVLEVNKKQCQPSQLSLAGPCGHSTESHVITLFVSRPEQSATRTGNSLETVWRAS